MTRLRARAVWLLVLATAAGSVQITMRTGVPAVWGADAIAACAVLSARSRRGGPSYASLLGVTWACIGLGNVLGGRHFGMAVALAAIHTAAVLVLVLVLIRGSKGRYTLASWRDLRRTITAAALAGLVFAAGSTALLTVSGTTSRLLSWSAWSLGAHLAGSLVVLPLGAVRSPTPRRPAAAEVTGQALVLAGALVVAFTTPFTVNATFLLVPALLWAAARFPASWANWQLAVVAVVVTLLTLARVGPLVEGGDPRGPHAMTTSVQTFLVLTALLTLAFSTSVAAERAAVTRYLHHDAGVGRLLESAGGTAFIATDVEGLITLFNSGAERLLGYSAADVVGVETPLRFHLPEEVAARAVERGLEFGFAAVMAEDGDGEHLDQQWTWVTKDGTRRLVSLSRAVVRDHWGGPTAYLVIARDVTDSIAAERALRSALATERDLNQRLREVDAAKGEFIANVSHELRTPLATIIGATELLQDGVAGRLQPRQEDLVEKVNRNSARLLGLIEDLLTLGAVSEGQFAIDAAEVDLRVVVRRTLTELFCPSEVAQVRTEIPTHPVVVAGDAEQLVRLIGNLVGNACKFTPPAGRIRVVVRSTTDGPRVDVTDTGVGIAAEDQPLVFERFFRTRSSREAEVPGTGLGLSIVRSIARAHGAEVDCVSTPGEGSTFSVRFPARSPVPTRRETDRSYR